MSVLRLLSVPLHPCASAVDLFTFHFSLFTFHFSLLLLLLFLTLCLLLAPRPRTRQAGMPVLRFFYFTFDSAWSMFRALTTRSPCFPRALGR